MPVRDRVRPLPSHCFERPRKKWQFDGLAQEPKERFLLPLLPAQRDARMAAERAELHELAAAAAQTVHTIVAQDFPAVGALVRRARPGMAWTDQGAIRQHHRRRRAGNVELGNGDGDVGRLDQKLDVSHPQGFGRLTSLASVMGWPSRKVPLVESQSRAMTPSSASRISQCLAEMLGCSMGKSFSGLRPKRLTPRLSSITRLPNPCDFNY